MVNTTSFGRRGDLQRPLGRSMGAIEATARTEFRDRSVAPPRLAPEKVESLSLDDDLRQWKLARRQIYAFPWRLLSGMATACFSIAGFVLPDSVNDNVDWLLYALAAISMYVGFRKRRQS